MSLTNQSGISDTSAIIFEETTETLPVPPFDKLQPLISKTLFTTFKQEYSELLQTFNNTNDNQITKNTQLFIDEFKNVPDETLRLFFKSYSELLKRFDIDFHVNEQQQPEDKEERLNSIIQTSN